MTNCVLLLFSGIWEWHSYCIAIAKRRPNSGLREEDMTLKIQRSSSDGLVIFALTGRIQMEHIVELQNMFYLEGAYPSIILDLGEVKLVDRETVKFLTRCEMAGVRLKNCPAYIQEWIRKERSR